MRVEDAPEHQFAAGVDEFDDHDVSLEGQRNSKNRKIGTVKGPEI
jgi:hypothetical protein